MVDLLLTTDHDLFIMQRGDIVVADSVSQAIKVRLLWFMEEWKFGPKLGVPYFQQILGKGSSNVLIECIFRQVILSVDEVRELRLTHNKAERILTVVYTAVTDTEMIKEEVTRHV